MEMRSTPGHRLRDIEHDGGAKVRFLLVLPHHPPIRAGRDLPIHEAEVVACLVWAIVGELHRESLAGRPVETGHESIDDPASDDLDVTERREGSRLMKIGANGGAHRTDNLTAVPPARRTAAPSVRTPAERCALGS